MLDISAYFASQEAKEGTTPEDVIEVGQQLYRGGDLERGITACIACHGPRGNGMELANFPDISGQHPAYIKSQLEQFRSGQRANDLNGMMRDIAKRLTDDDIRCVVEVPRRSSLTFRKRPIGRFFVSVNERQQKNFNLDCKKVVNKFLSCILCRQIITTRTC